MTRREQDLGVSYYVSKSSVAKVILARCLYKAGQRSEPRRRTLPMKNIQQMEKWSLFSLSILSNHRVFEFEIYAVCNDTTRSLGIQSFRFLVGSSSSRWLRGGVTTRSLTRFELGGKRLRVSTFSCMPRGEEKKGEKKERRIISRHQTLTITFSTVLYSAERAGGGKRWPKTRRRIFFPSLSLSYWLSLKVPFQHEIGHGSLSPSRPRVIFFPIFFRRLSLFKKTCW